MKVEAQVMLGCLPLSHSTLLLREGLSLIGSLTRVGQGPSCLLLTPCTGITGSSQIAWLFYFVFKHKRWRCKLGSSFVPSEHFAHQVISPAQLQLGFVFLIFRL